MNESKKIGVQIIVRGLVQGVYFRAFTCEAATRLNLTGQVLNLANGTVKVVAYGVKSNIDELINLLTVGPPQARVDNLDLTYIGTKEEPSDFKILR